VARGAGKPLLVDRGFSHNPTMLLHSDANRLAPFVCDFYYCANFFALLLRFLRLVNTENSTRCALIKKLWLMTSTAIWLLWPFYWDPEFKTLRLRQSSIMHYVWPRWQLVIWLVLVSRHSILDAPFVSRRQLGLLIRFINSLESVADSLRHQ